MTHLGHLNEDIAGFFDDGQYVRDRRGIYPTFAKFLRRKALTHVPSPKEIEWRSDMSRASSDESPIR